MDNQNAGSFMANGGGGGSAVAEAMARRGIGGGGVTNQAGGGGPAGDQAVLPSTVPAQSVAPASPQGAITEAQSSLGASPAQASTTPSLGNPEAQLIIKAMDSYLKSIAAVNKVQAGAR